MFRCLYANLHDHCAYMDTLNGGGLEHSQMWLFLIRMQHIEVNLAAHRCCKKYLAKMLPFCSFPTAIFPATLAAPDSLEQWLKKWVETNCCLQQGMFLCPLIRHSNVEHYTNREGRVGHPGGLLGEKKIYTKPGQIDLKGTWIYKKKIILISILVNASQMRTQIMGLIKRN